MTDRTHSDDNAKARAIIDDAIAELLLMGMESRDQAAMMMAFQSAIRIEENEIRRELAKLIAELVWDEDDTDEGAEG
jgi:hypothetical protein